MSIEIYKVNNLFTIKRVSVYGWVGVQMNRQIEYLGRDVNRMQWGMGWSGVVGLGWKG